MPERVVILLYYHRLPRYATKFIEMCLMVTADHGPAVSGAHNTIVCSNSSLLPQVAKIRYQVYRDVSDGDSRSWSCSVGSPQYHSVRKSW